MFARGGVGREDGRTWERENVKREMCCVVYYEYKYTVCDKDKRVEEDKTKRKSAGKGERTI